MQQQQARLLACLLAGPGAESLSLEPSVLPDHPAARLCWAVSALCGALFHLLSRSLLAAAVMQCRLRLLYACPVPSPYSSHL